MENTKVFNKEITEVDPFEFINNIRKTYGIDNPKSNYSEKGIHICYYKVIKTFKSSVHWLEEGEENKPCLVLSKAWKEDEDNDITQMANHTYAYITDDPDIIKLYDTLNDLENILNRLEDNKEEK